VLTKAKCHFLLGEEETAITLFKKYGELSYNYEYEGDVAIMEICRRIKKGTGREEYQRHLEKLGQLVAMKREDDCKIFKLRDMHQIRASIFLLLNDYQQAITEFESTLRLFNIEKTKEMEKHFIEDSEEFEDEWSEVEIKFNLSLALLCLQVTPSSLRAMKTHERCCSSSIRVVKKARTGVFT
jgi:tetratricopeptide (TPR) repeat protein